MNFSKFNLAVVIPAYRTEKEILAVLQGIPTFIRHIIVVDDASPDSSADLVTAAAKKNRRILLVRHAKNQGVGGAMVTGFKKALELGAEIVIKLDGDGQMDPQYIPALITPLITGEADYAKGNRFRDFDALRQMPIVRRIGNLGLSFLTKAATGYWNIFDPTNGYFAIRAEMLAQLPLDRIDKGYYFETSMLSRLYLRDAFVQDVTIPARYRNEVSSLSIRRVLFEFPYKLTRTLIKRIILKYFIFDFSMMSIYLLTGIPLLLFGLIFGITKWIQYAELGIAAPTGTVILPTLSVILAIQILLSAIEIDLNAAPRKAISKALV
ncbi:MAG TPA: glycosyltransferase family 2 protein [Anaerolineales bacterium]|nr:glycosyltransferase family 2 protein [Anaerolineales bacterium]HNF93680.1 glycosyltransferase family 2 protein [Anaerolineales bacterium]